jgi:DNA-directed RNA polymerase subunit K/omega
MDAESNPAANPARESREVMNQTANRVRPMTRYERAAIVGMRMEQLQRGATPLVEVPDRQRTTIRAIALKELDERVLPFMVMRKQPNGQKEVWHLNQLLD